MSGAAALRTVPPLIRHCKPCRVEWNGNTEAGCWMCGTTGEQGRVPLPDGRTAPGLHGAASWRPGDDECAR